MALTHTMPRVITSAICKLMKDTATIDLNSLGRIGLGTEDIDGSDGIGL
jgi:hypothetical protein